MNTACASFLQPYPAYYYLGASDIMSGGGWPTTSYHEEPQLDTTCWKTNDWNTLGKYPFATKIRLGGEEFPIEQIIPMPIPFPTASIQIATHSRQRSQSHSADSERTEEPVTSPQDDGTMSPMSPPEGLVGSHIELIKLPSGQWQCPHCSKQFRRRDRGQAHVNVHINTRPYRCEGACGNPICDRSYFSQESLQSHTQHAMIICETCGKELRKKNISRHRKRYCTTRATP